MSDAKLLGLDRWTPLVEFVRHWYMEELRLPDNLDAVRKRLRAAEAHLGRPVPESLREWFLLTGERPSSITIDFPSLPLGPSRQQGTSTFGFNADCVGMLGESESANYFEVLSGSNHWSWAVAREDEAPDPRVRFTGEGWDLGDANDAPGPLSALLTYAVVKGTLDLGHGWTSDFVPSGAIGPYAAGVQVKLVPDDMFEGSDVNSVYRQVSPVPLPQGERLLSDAKGDTLILCWDNGHVCGAITRTPEARDRLERIVAEAEKVQDKKADEQEKQREKTREDERGKREARLNEELAKVDGGRGDAELLASLEAIEGKLRRYEKAILTDMRMAFGSGRLSAAQKLKAVKLLEERG